MPPSSIPTSTLTHVMTFNDVSLAYRKKCVLHHISGQIKGGTLTAIIGLNGCGKSTLMKAMAGLMRPTAGVIKSDFCKEKIAYLSQISSIDRTFPITVFDFVCCGFWSQMGAFKELGQERTASVSSALEAVGMRAYEDVLIGELSGGQFQRIRFARMLLQDADLFLLDEPFAAIDEQTITDLMCLLHYLHGQGKTIVCVLHNINLVREQFPDVIVLARHGITAWGKTQTSLLEHESSSGVLNTEHHLTTPQTSVNATQPPSTAINTTRGNV